MSRNFGAKAGWLTLAAIAFAVLVAPIAEATPVNYDFKVDVTSGPLSGTSNNGSFSFDSSSIVPGGGLTQQLGLLTAFNFTFNGTTYNANTANTGWLGFDSAGNLDSFAFGNNCNSGSCGVMYGTDQWFAAPGAVGFGYSTPETNAFFNGNVTFARLDSLPVPEPGALSLFGFGVLMLGALYTGRRRRMS